MTEKMTKFLKSIKALWRNKLTIICLILVFIGFILWRIEKNNGFGLNFFTEMIGVAITTLLINKLIQSRKESGLIPQKVAVYEDIRLFVSRYINFWVETFRVSVPEDDPEVLKEFFSEKGMSKILQYLYLNSEPNDEPPRKWWDWIADQAKEFKDFGDKILDRHVHILDPEIYAYVHQLTESSFNNCLMSIPSVRQIDLKNKYPRVEILGAYSIPPDQKDFNAILNLHKWCEEQYAKYKKINQKINRVLQYTPQNNKNTPPKCQIPAETLKRQKVEWQDFRNKNGNK